jgi:hypothetical protein
MSWLNFALRDSRLPKPRDDSNDELIVEVRYLDGFQEVIPITKEYTFRRLAFHIGPSNLMLFRDMGGYLEEIRERGRMCDALDIWKRDGQASAVIVVPFYQSQRPAKRDLLSAKHIDKTNYLCVAAQRTDCDENLVYVNLDTTVGMLARHLCKTRCIGLFTAVRDVDNKHFTHYKLLPQDCNISETILALANAGEVEKEIVYPLIRFGGFEDDDGEPSNVDICESDEEGYADEGSDSGEGEESSGEESVSAAKANTDAQLPAEDPTVAADTLGRPDCSVTAQLPAASRRVVSEDDRAGSANPVDFDDIEAVTRVSAPVRELCVTAAEIARFAADILDGDVLCILSKTWDVCLKSGATVEHTVHAFITEAIRLAGKEDQLRLRRISKEEIYAALLLGEADAQQQRDLVQLDVPLLACTAVSEVLSEADARYFSSRGATVRKILPEIRERLRPGERGDVAAAEAECWPLMEKFLPVRLVLSVSEQVELISPAPDQPICSVSAMRHKSEPVTDSPIQEASRPLVRLSPITLSPKAVLFADRVAAVGEVPAEIGTELVVKGLLVEGIETSSILLTVKDNNYPSQRWFTRPATSLTEVLHYIVLAVLCPGSQLRDLLLEADRANGGDVSAHFDECKEGYKQILEGYRINNQRAWAAYEQELEEERKYPPVFDGKVEIA